MQIPRVACAGLIGLLTQVWPLAAQTNRVERAAAALGGVMVDEYDNDYPTISARYWIHTAPFGAAEAELTAARLQGQCTTTLEVGAPTRCEGHRGLFMGSLTYGPTFQVWRFRPYLQAGLSAGITTEGDVDGGGIGSLGLAILLKPGFAVRAEIGRRWFGDGDGMDHILGGIEIGLPFS